MKLLSTLAVYVDMDDTIADFKAEPHAVERFAIEPNFFYNLKPLPKNLQAIAQLLRNGQKVYIITASPNGRADYDKMRWLRKYLPEMPYEDIIIVPLGKDKSQYMRTENGILFDDYQKNLVQWTSKKNNRAVRVARDGDILDGLRVATFTKVAILNAD